MEKMKRFMCVAVALLVAAKVCHAGSSLDAKLAKLEAATKAHKSTPKSTVKVSSTDTSATDILRGKVKTLAERLDEIAGRQKEAFKLLQGLSSSSLEALEGSSSTIHNSPSCSFTHGRKKI